MKRFYSYSSSILSLDDFPSDKKNCGTCTRKSGICPRTKSDKTIHNGYLYGTAGEPSGIIYCCPHYTGLYEQAFFDFG